MNKKDTCIEIFKQFKLNKYIIINILEYDEYNINKAKFNKVIKQLQYYKAQYLHISIYNCCGCNPKCERHLLDYWSMLMEIYYNTLIIPISLKELHCHNRYGDDWNYYQRKPTFQEK